MTLAPGPARMGEAARPAPFPPFTLYCKLQFARNIKAADGPLPAGACATRPGPNEEKEIAWT